MLQTKGEKIYVFRIVAELVLTCKEVASDSLFNIVYIDLLIVVMICLEFFVRTCMTVLAVGTEGHVTLICHSLSNCQL